MQILYNPNFFVVEDGDEYVFYNSIRHYVCRVSKLDLALFNLIYLHKNLENILANVPSVYADYVQRVYHAVTDNHILSEEPIEFGENIKDSAPQNYYLHLTYKCNLNCVYCYNKQIRNDFNEMSLNKWETILNEIMPYAHNIVITGGEPFLSPILPDIVKLIKNKKSSVHLEIISNCMTQFERYPQIDTIMGNIDGIIFSCDSLSDKQQPRINFNPELFRHNIAYLRKKYDKLKITTSSIYSKNNHKELKVIEEFCKSVPVNFRQVLIVPNNQDDVALLPSLSEYISTLPSTVKEVEGPRLYCGAGVGVLSIDPFGNVYPCQSLHSKDYKLGNILESSLANIIRSDKRLSLAKAFNVKNITKCKDCSLKYICGAGCRAATLKLEGNAATYPQTMCDYYKANAIQSLRMTPSLSEINLYR